MTELKMYEAPKMEVVEVEMESQVMAGSTNAKDVEEDPWD